MSARVGARSAECPAEMHSTPSISAVAVCIARMSRRGTLVSKSSLQAAFERITFGCLLEDRLGGESKHHHVTFEVCRCQPARTDQQFTRSVFQQVRITGVGCFSDGGGRRPRAAFVRG